MFADIIEGFTEISALAGFLTLAVTVLGAISLFLANLGRYFQSKKFGIPIKAVHQANISDSAELWIALVGTLGPGVFVPIVLLNVDLAWWQLLATVFAAFTFGLLSTKSTMKMERGKKLKRAEGEYIVHQDFTIQFLLVLSLASATAYVHLHGVYNDVFMSEIGWQGGFFATLWVVIAIICLGLHALLLLILLLTHISRNLFGGSDVMTTVIDGENYLIAMRHNVYQWILIRFEIEEYTEGGEQVAADTKCLLFVKGEFIMRDLSILDKPITYHRNFRVVEKGKRIYNEQG